MNVAPRSRSERHDNKHKEHLEKQRLKERTGNYYRYEEVTDPIRVMEDCPSYLSGRDQMISGGENLAERLLQDREDAHIRDLNIVETRRAERLAREEERWRMIDEKERYAQDRIERLQADPMAGKKNLSGQPFNIVNAKYDNTKEGQDLKFRDEMTMYRGQLRTINLAHKGGLGFNPITGDQIHTVPLPDRPVRKDNIIG